MKANKQSKIVVPKSGFKRSRFNWSHDVNTTFSWGELQPTQCKLLVPGSKTTFDAQTLIRLAPMVAPTFGRVKYKTYNQFVSLAEVMPNFDAMMAQEPVSTAYATKVPQAIPSIHLANLSAWCLMGARASLYFADSSADQVAGKYKAYYRNTPLDDSSAEYSAWSAHALNLYGNVSPFYLSADAWNNSSNGVLPSVDGIAVSLGNFGGAFSNVFSNNTYFQFVLGARLLSDLCPVNRGFVDGNYDTYVQDYQREVTFDSADLVLEGSFNYDSSDPTKVEYFALALEFSDFGKRIRKLIQGCGYQVNLTSNAQVSLLPLFATYKAYFDIFGLELYQGWETTYCAKLIKYIENNFATNLDFVFTRTIRSSFATLDNSNYGVAFLLMEAANMWYTDDVDYVSAHLDKLAVSPNADTLNAGFISWTNLGWNTYLNLGSTSSANSDGTNTSMSQVGTTTIGTGLSNAGHDFVNNVYHTEIDAEILKRMYKWTNRNSILGRRIAEILRAQGLGKYVDECKSNYIGSTDTMVTISDVVSTAATQDASLGEYGGKGLQYVNDEQLVFENDSYGYWITLSTIVPESGYTQGLDPTLTSLDKMNLYNPDFDAIGMEATPKQNIVHTNYILGAIDGGNYTFGFIPRYSKFKVCGNLTNGDFNRHNMRNTYLPYTLDKQLNVNDFSVQFENVASDLKTATVQLDKSSRVVDLPVAGNTWRYPTKYNWLGNFDRIFLRVGERDDAELSAVNESGVVGWSDYNPDNFLSHSIFNLQCYAPMKPIEDSYGLDEPESNNVGVSFVSKA